MIFLLILFLNNIICEVCVLEWVGDIDGDSFDNIWSKISIVFQNFQFE